jgi:hypothetical protein
MNTEISINKNKIACLKVDTLGTLFCFWGINELSR